RHVGDQLGGHELDPTHVSHPLSLAPGAACLRLPPPKERSSLHTCCLWIEWRYALWKLRIAVKRHFEPEHEHGDGRYEETAQLYQFGRPPLGHDTRWGGPRPISKQDAISATFSQFVHQCGQVLDQRP